MSKSNRSDRPHILFVDDQGKRHFERVCPNLSAVKCMKARPFRYDTLDYAKSVTQGKAQFAKYASRVSNRGLKRIITALGALENGSWAIDHQSGLSLTQMKQIQAWTGTLVIFDLDGTLQQMDYLWGGSFAAAVNSFTLLCGEKITPYELATFYLGGDVRTRHIKQMFDVLKQRGIKVKILTLNRHAHLARYVSDLFKAIGVHIGANDIIKAGKTKGENIKDILLTEGARTVKGRTCASKGAKT